MTEILANLPASIVRAALALRAGHPVVMPTETVYGLAADATSATAIEAVFTAKARPSDDPLIVHVTPGLLGKDWLSGLVTARIVAPQLATPQSQTARALFAAFWPGPLTVVLPRGPAILPAVTSGLPAVAVRMPVHPVATALIDACGLPLVAPSANLFGQISPTTAQAAFAELNGRVGLILDGGACTIGVESTVVRVDDDGCVGVLRPGQITRSHLAAATSTQVYVVGRDEGSASSPGRTLSHYAPRTPLVLVTQGPHAWGATRWADVQQRCADRPVAYVPWTPDTSQVGSPVPMRVHPLSATGSAEDAARNLYATLRSLDDTDAALIVLQRPPAEDGLYAALIDRLQRAAHGTPPLAR